MCRILPIAILAALFGQSGPATVQQLVVCGWDEVFILDLAAGEGGRPRKVWTWRAKDRTDLPDAFKPLFGSTDECKPYDRGARVLITSSGGAAALVDRSSDRVLFYGRATNAHSADLLPNDRIAVAASHDAKGKGDRLILFAIGQPDVELWSDELPWGHGVVWDARRQLLWALADEDIRVYRLRDWQSSRPSLVRTATIPLPEGGGHDLQAVDDTRMSVTTGNRCWLFDRDARTFSPHPQLGPEAKVKGISLHPVTGRIVYVQAEGKDWWAERLRFLNPADTFHVPGEHFYKARWVF